MEFNISDNKLYIDEQLFPLSDYYILKQLGHGANAIVFSVLNLKLGRLEALKIWKPRKG